MKFKLKKNEIILISILAVLIYSLVMYKFVWSPIVPEIDNQKNQMLKLMSDKQQLNNDLSQLSLKKTDLASQKAGDERLTAYLSNELNVTDCIEYVDKLARVMGSDITDINITAPEKKELGKSMYYEIKMEFNTIGNIKKVTDMVKYIENSSKLIKIGKFQISIPKGDSGGIAETSHKPEEELFNAAMSLSMYALNIEAADKLYEYGRHKFNRYEYGSQDAFGTSENEEVSFDSDNIKATDSDKALDSTDFQVIMSGFLKAGDNLVIIGTDIHQDRLSLKTNKSVKMDMKLEGESYLITVSADSGQIQKLSGSIPSRDLRLDINADFPQIEENKDIQLELTIENNSEHNLNLMLEDKSGRVTIKDRQGGTIKEDSDKEKLIMN